MKKDIAVIRDSIARIVSMLTLRSIKVTQRGSRAYVSYHPKTEAIIELNIPYLPDDASEEFIAAIQGFIDHEIGHVLHSDPKELIRAKKLGARIANLHNAIEDVFIERQMEKTFTGSGMNLEAVRRYYLDKIALPKITKALADGNIEEARGYASLAAFRAWGGQVSAADFIKRPEVADLVKPVKDKLGDDLVNELAKTTSSKDCVDLAIKFKAKLETPKPPPPPPPEPEELPFKLPKPPAPELPKPEPEPEPEGTDPGEGGEVAESTEGSEDHGRPEEEREEVAGPVEGEGEATGGEPGEDPSAEPESDPAEPSSKDPEDESTSSEGTYDGLTEESPEEPPEEDGESVGLGAETPADESDDPSEEVGSGTSAPSEDPEDAPKVPETSSMPGGADDPTAAEEAEAESEPEPDPLAEMFDTERDFDDDLSSELSKSAAEEIGKSDYAVYSTDWDRIVVPEFKGSADAVSRMENMMLDKVGVMQKSLERAIAAQARKMWNPGMRRGRISPGSLYRTSVGDDRVFRQRFETRAKNTALSLVVDCSGSMSHGGRIALAGSAAYGLAMVLERLKLQYEVIGFTTVEGGSEEMTELIRLDAEAQGSSIYGMGWGRLEPLFMPIFKQFDGRLDTEAKARIASLTEYPEWLQNNVDGECVQIAGNRLLQRKAERHVMIVLSDGMPAAWAANGLNAHLKSVVAKLEKSGVETIGIGIQTKAVKQFYPKNVTLDDVSELPGKLMQELTKILLS